MLRRLASRLININPPTLKNSSDELANDREENVDENGAKPAEPVHKERERRLHRRTSHLMRELENEFQTNKASSRTVVVVARCPDGEGGGSKYAKSSDVTCKHCPFRAFVRVPDTDTGAPQYKEIDVADALARRSASQSEASHSQSHSKSKSLTRASKASATSRSRFRKNKFGHFEIVEEGRDGDEIRSQFRKIEHAAARREAELGRLVSLKEAEQLEYTRKKRALMARLQDEHSSEKEARREQRRRLQDMRYLHTKEIIFRRRAAHTKRIREVKRLKDAKQKKKLEAEQAEDGNEQEEKVE